MTDSPSGTKFLNVMAVISVTLAAAVTWRVFFPPTGDGGGEAPKAVVVPEWRRYAVGRHQFGPADAPITIIEFADFECPACRQFNLETLGPIRAKYANQAKWVFRHLPLGYHRFALPAARAAECAADQSRFEQFHDALYRGQDSLGLKPWAKFADEAGVPDSASFRACSESSEPLPTIEADLRDAKALGSRGTPTIVVNGIHLPGLPKREDLIRVIDSLLVERNSRSS